MPHGPYRYPLVANPDLSREEHGVFGLDAVKHQITGMVIEQGSGCLSPDEQARCVHIPEIARTQGRAAAAAMLAKLDAAAAGSQSCEGVTCP
jgi:hypothetical protein